MSTCTKPKSTRLRLTLVKITKPKSTGVKLTEAEVNPHQLGAKPLPKPHWWLTLYLWLKLDSKSKPSSFRGGKFALQNIAQWCCSMMDGPPNHQCARELISSCIFSQILILMLSLIFVPGVSSLALSTSICRCLIDSSIAFRKFFWRLPILAPFLFCSAFSLSFSTPAFLIL